MEGWTYAAAAAAAAAAARKCVLDGVWRMKAEVVHWQLLSTRAQANIWLTSVQKDASSTCWSPGFAPSAQGCHTYSAIEQASIIQHLAKALLSPAGASGVLASKSAFARMNLDVQPDRASSHN